MLPSFLRRLKQPSHGKLKFASWCMWWTAQKQSANTLATCWRQTELASILANLFVSINLYLTCERLTNACWWLSTNQNTRTIQVICVTNNKMADGREDERATFQFIEEVQNCRDMWDVSSLAYKDTKKQACVVVWRGNALVCQLFKVCQHEFANLSLPCEGRLRNRSEILLGSQARL